MKIKVEKERKEWKTEGPFTDPLRFEILLGKLDGGVSTSIIFR